MLPQPITSPPLLSTAWRCIAEDKSGRAWTGKVLHPAQEFALLAILAVERRIAAGDVFMIETADGALPEDEYSHPVPVPA